MIQIVGPFAARTGLEHSFAHPDVRIAMSERFSALSRDLFVYCFQAVAGAGGFGVLTLPRGRSREMRARPNTVHLTKSVAFCMRQGQEATVGAYGCGTPSGCPDHGLHQPWRNNQDVSSLQHRASAFNHREVQHSSARSAGTGGCLLRHRSGAVHAIVLSRGIALSSGSSPVAARSVIGCAGGWEIGHLSGPNAAGLGATAAVA